MIFDEDEDKTEKKMKEDYGRAAQEILDIIKKQKKNKEDGDVKYE